MKVRSLHRSPIALAAALAIATAAYPAFAQTTNKDSGGTTTSQSGANSAAQSADKTASKSQLSAHDREAMKVSEDGFNAMRSVRASRMAIFNGEPKVAHEMVSKAESSLKSAAKDEKTLESNAGQAGNANSGGNSKDNNSGTASSSGSNSQSADKTGYIAIDGQITVVDSFIDSPAKQAHIDKANEHIAKGDSKGAMDELKLAEVGASFTHVLMPLQATTKHVDEASKLMDQHKYYQANLALKAAEDGLIIQSVALSDTPEVSASGASSTHKNSTNQNPTSSKPKS